MNRNGLAVAMFAGMILPAVAQDAPGKINLQDPDLVMVDSSVIQIPLEIFSSLDKLGMQDWAKQVENRTILLDTNR